MFRRAVVLFSFLVVLLGLVCGRRSQDHHRASSEPVYLGDLPNLSHGTGGKVFALDDRTLQITNFNYDGLAPDAYFWAGQGSKPSVTGFAIPDENGTLQPLGVYRNANLVLRLPRGKSLRNIRYFGVWCRNFQINFGHIPVNISKK